MFYVVLRGGGHCTCKEFTDYAAGLKEYRRQARNAWRRKSAYCQIQFHNCRGVVLERMQYRQGAGVYNLELTTEKPACQD